VTSKIKLGTGICLVIEHDPKTLAKQVATLDALSNGRVLFGIGGGWNKEEMANHGTDFGQRWAVLRERSRSPSSARPPSSSASRSTARRASIGWCSRCRPTPATPFSRSSTSTCP